MLHTVHAIQKFWELYTCILYIHHWCPLKLFLILQEHVNEIDFDYMEYARQRFEQYCLRKPALLGSSGTTPDVALTDGNYTI